MPEGSGEDGIDRIWVYADPDPSDPEGERNNRGPPEEKGDRFPVRAEKANFLIRPSRNQKGYVAV